MVELMHFGVGKDSLEREKSEGEERSRIHCQREENSSGVWHTSVLKLRPTQGTERTTCYCFFPVPVPAGPLPGEGGEAEGGVQRRPFALHRAEVYRRYRCSRFRSGLTRFRYAAWFVSCENRLLRVSQPVKRRAPESGFKSLESSGMFLGKTPAVFI